MYSASEDLVHDPAAQRRFQLAHSVATIVFTASLLFAILYRGYFVGWTVIFVALVPALAVGWMVYETARYVRAMDEMHRALYARACQTAFLVSVFCITGYGLLEEIAGFPVLPTFIVGPLGLVVLSIVSAFSFPRSAE